MQVLIGGTRLVFSIPSYAIVALAGLLSLLVVSRQRFPAYRAGLIATVVFFAYILLRIATSPVPSLAAPDLYMVMGGLVLYSLTAIYLTSARIRLLILGTLGAMVLVQSWIAYQQFAVQNNWMPFGLIRADYHWRASGFYICPNDFAGFVEVIALFCLSICVWSRWNRWVKIASALTGCVAVCELAVSGSRGGYLSLTFGLIVFIAISLVMVKRLRPEKFKLALIQSGVFSLTAIGLGCYLIPKYSHILSRVENIPDWNNMRLKLWAAALTQFQSSPIFGTGCGTYTYLGRLFRDPTMQNDPVYVHNDYLHLLAEFGSVGATLFVAYFIIQLWGGGTTQLRLARPHRLQGDDRAANALAINTGALCAVAAFVVHSAVDFNLHIPANFLLFAVIFGILANPGVKISRHDAAQRFSFWRLAPPLLAIWLGLLTIPRWMGDFYAEKARVALRDEHYADSIKFANFGLRYVRSNPDLYFYLGESRRVIGARTTNMVVRKFFSQSALEAFRKAYALYPQDEQTLVRMAQAYDALGDFSEADEWYQSALRWDPNLAVIYGFYGWHYAIQGKLKEAKAMFDRSQKLSQNSIATQGLESVLQPQKPAAKAPPKNQ